MPRGRRPHRALATLALSVVLSLMAAGCVSMPSGGPVLSYTVTQGATAPNQPYLQIIPPSPGQGGNPTDIVQGFMAANASFVGQQQVAREYLTSAASKNWNPGWSATVFNSAPLVKPVRVSPKQGTATVTVSGDVQATLNNSSGYAVASAKPRTGTFRFDLVKDRGGQWRISKVYNNTLFLTTTEFAADYQLRNLYFFDPSMHYLVPDPVYVPLQATQDALVNGLVRDLIRPPEDWLGQPGAVKTAFPAGTTSQPVTVDGLTASVNLRLPGAAASRLSDTVQAEVSAQLWYTLSGEGQGQQGQVQSVALYVNGHAYIPPGASPDNPVQNSSQFAPADGPQTPGFYYLTKTGELMTQASTTATTTARPSRVSVIGRGYASLAISPNGEYVAALHDGSVYTGTVGAHSLTLRDAGMAVTSLSWDRNDNLWVAGSTAIAVLLATPGKPVTPPIPVSVMSVTPSGTACANNAEVTAIRVAPDGVRIAIVYGGQQQELAFGAIVAPDSQAQQFTIRLSPFSVCGTSSGTFRDLSWYGADDVVALGDPDDTLTEYPVNGGTLTMIPGPDSSGVQSITASGAKEGGLIAGLRDGGMLIDTSGTSGAWRPLPAGRSPAFPG